MKIYAATEERLIRDDLGLKDVLAKYHKLVLESQIPVALNLNGQTLLLNYVDTLIGPAVVGFVDQQVSLELLRMYLDNLLLQEHVFPSFMVELSNLVHSWKGKMTVGLLSAQKDEIRFDYRAKLGRISSQIINLGDKDLYVFPTDQVSVHKDVKLAMSCSCRQILDAIRQAFVVDRYVDSEGLCTYQDLQNSEICVNFDENDINMIHKRLLSRNLKEFSEKAEFSLQEAYRVEKSLEEKYWLFFDIGIECHLYVTGLKNWQRKVQ